MDDTMDRLGRLADNLDACLYASLLPVSPQTHISFLKDEIRKVRDAIVEIVCQETGENPWEYNKLTG